MLEADLSKQFSWKHETSNLWCVLIPLRLKPVAVFFGVSMFKLGPMSAINVT